MHLQKESTYLEGVSYLKGSERDFTIIEYILSPRILEFRQIL